MFDVGWSELLVIGVVALVVIGPKELPGVLRSAGQWVAKVRRMASDFQGQFQEALREAELADVKKQFDDLTTAKDFGLDSFNPAESVRKEIESATASLTREATPAEAPATQMASAQMSSAQPTSARVTYIDPAASTPAGAVPADQVPAAPTALTPAEAPPAVPPAAEPKPPARAAS